MIRIERDPDFWTAVAAHPAVARTLFGMAPEQIGALAARGDMLPLAAEHGGYLFARMDGLGFVCELHSLFTPKGWGREAVRAGIEALHAVFLAGYRVITTFEVEGNPRSRPPRRCGFAPAGEGRESPLGRLTMWTATKASWEASPMWRDPQCRQ